MSNLDPKAVWPGWETVRLIGRGSFGAVYEIQRDVFGHREKAALKVITIPQSESDISEMRSDGYDDESITSTFQAHLKSIVAEYSLMRKLNGSANVVNCDDVRYVQHENGFGWDIFIKMELLTPLTQALPAAVPEEQVVKIGRDLARALVQCKRFDIVHRDIKPQNIFVSPLGDYKLGDFGIAKTIEKTSGGTKIGTYKYMAPEVYNNQPYGAGADIYSLGLVLYWLLNERRMPFLPLPPAKLGAGMEEQARLRRFRGEPIPAPLHGSPALRQIVLKCCAYDPKDRFQSAEELLRALDGLGNSEFGVRNSELRPETPTPVGATFGRPSVKAPVPEEDGTVGVFDASRGKTTSGRSPVEEQIPAEDATVGVYSEAGNKMHPPTKRKPGFLVGLIFTIATLAVVAVVLLIFLSGKSGGKSSNSSAGTTTVTTNTPKPTAAVNIAEPTSTPANTSVTNAPSNTAAPTPSQTSAPMATPEPLSMSLYYGNVGQLKMRSFSSASASSVLSDKQYGDFPASNAIDGRTDTSWQEGVDGLGEGESITLWFDESTAVSVLRVYPGYTMDEAAYELNGRPRKLRFEFSNNESCTFELEDSFGGKDIALSHSVTTTYVKITILSAYDSGSRWKDTAISEVIAYG